MNKIWFQLTGSHSRGQPEYILHKDKRFFIGGMHSMDDPNLEIMKDDRKAHKVHNFLKLKHTRQDIIPPPDKNGYPKYSWWYENKMLGEQAFAEAQKILSYDPNAYFIFFSCTPMLSVLKLAKLFTKELSNKVHIIYYKRHFFHNEVSLDNTRTWFDMQTDNSQFQDITSKKIEEQIVELADDVYLADTLNTCGNPDIDQPEIIRQLINIRDNYLKNNPKVILKCLKDKVYNLYDNIS